MMELTASQPVLINRGMLYLDWNLGDPTPWGHHLGSTSSLESGSPALPGHRVPAQAARFVLVHVLLSYETFSCTRLCMVRRDAAFIPLADTNRICSILFPSIFTDLLPLIGFFSAPAHLNWEGFSIPSNVLYRAHWGSNYNGARSRRFFYCNYVFMFIYSRFVRPFRDTPWVIAG